MASGKIPSKQLGAGVAASYETEGDPLDLSYDGVTTPGITQTLINHTVAVAKKNYLLQLFISCRIEGVYEIFVDSQLVGSGRTSASTPNDFYSWRPYQLAEAGEIVKVEYTGMVGRPVSDIECFMQARNVDA